MPHIRTLSALALLVTVALALPGTASAAEPVETVIQDDAELLHQPDERVLASMQRIRALGVDRVRLTAGWSVLAPEPDAARKPDFDAANPGAYPQGAWRGLDRAVTLARKAGLEVMIDIAFWAPRWATRDDPAATNRLRTDVDPTEFGLFSSAVAARYSGTFRPIPDVGTSPPAPDRLLLDSLLGKKPPAALTKAVEPLPPVSLYTIWNEPNHPGFLMPQWQLRGGAWVPRSPDVYRKLVRAAYPAIKQAAPQARVLVGGTAPNGSRAPGKGGVPPLAFLRALACVDANLRPVTDGDCASFAPIPGDGWAHHPYSLHTEPEVDTRDRDNIPIAGVGRLAQTLRALVDSGRLAPGLADLYLTEYGYETNPPDPRARFGPERQGELLARAEAIATGTPAVRMWAQFLLRDLPGDPSGPLLRDFGDWQSGLLYADGTPKPAAATFALPAFARCVRERGRSYVAVWGRARGKAATGTVALERSADGGRGWSAATAATSVRAASTGRSQPSAVSAAVRPGIRYIPFRPGSVYRLRWLDAAGAERTTPPLASSCKGR